MDQKQIYIETYGCQMNVADSEVVLGIMSGTSFGITDDATKADVIFINTCSVRDNAEARVFQRLAAVKQYKKQNPGVVIGILGCMAERLRAELIDANNLVDVVVGPDEYRKLPALVNDAFAGHKGIAVKLSRVEHYDDIIPLRTEGIGAWVAVMRGCDKFCSFCIVPFTRGRERSRSRASIVGEVERLSRQGYKEITLLGQNVNSYHDGDIDFADLIAAVAAVDTTMRVRFMTPHPRDVSDKLIGTIASTRNICASIHLPVQSGSNSVLQRMNRTYTIEEYYSLTKRIRDSIAGVTLSTDIIAGFPGETENDHRATIDTLKYVRYDGAFMFKYSPREHTKAWGMDDDVSEEVKVRRLTEIIEVQNTIAAEINAQLVGSTLDVLVEKISAKSSDEWMGRTDNNKYVVFPKSDAKIGDRVNVKIRKANSATLIGTIV